MEAEKVNAVFGLPAGRKQQKQKKKEKRKQWSIQFLEFLLREMEDEKEQIKECPVEVADMGADGDCEIIVREMDERMVTGSGIPLQQGEDSLVLSRERGNQVLTSELYEDIVDHVKQVGNWKANVLYKIANEIMQNYYEGVFADEAVGELFRGCYIKCVEEKARKDAEEEKRYEILWDIYEYFCRANARKSVAQNEREGRRLVEKCGLSWAGTTYYNAEYYFSCKKIQKLFQSICNELSAEHGLAGIPFSDLEKQNQFYLSGGLTFHGVFVWIQQKDNYPSNQYGMKEEGKEPPECFVYLYRNHFEKAESTGIRFLEEEMRNMTEAKDGGAQIWRSYMVGGGREYHNGMSYLLEGSLMDETEEEMYGAAMGFLQNFKLYRVSGCVEFLRAGTCGLK